MNLIKINLLPYRELQLQQQKKSFEQLMVLGALAGIGLAALIYMVLSGAIATQNSRNESLEAGIKTLDAEIAEVKELQERKRQFLARKQKIEELDVKRFEGARVLDTLDQVDPEGAYITALEVNKKNSRNSKENRRQRYGKPRRYYPTTTISPWVDGSQTISPTTSSLGLLSDLFQCLTDDFLDVGF